MNLKHNDNTGTVGATQFHAFMNADDMLFIWDICPDATFAPTFPSAWGPHGSATPERHRKYYGDEEWPYYVHFMCNEAGMRLLAIMQMLGMEIAEEFDNGKTTIGQRVDRKQERELAALMGHGTNKGRKGGHHA